MSQLQKSNFGAKMSQAICWKIFLWSINLITGCILIFINSFEYSQGSGDAICFWFSMIANISLASTHTCIIPNSMLIWIGIYGTLTTASGILVALNMEPFSIINSRTIGRMVAGPLSPECHLAAIGIMVIIIGVISLLASLDVAFNRSQNAEPILLSYRRLDFDVNSNA